MALCGCGYNRKGEKTSSCRRHRGKDHISPRYNRPKKKATSKKAAKKKK